MVSKRRDNPQDAPRVFWDQNTEYTYVDSGCAGYVSISDGQAPAGDYQRWYDGLSDESITLSIN